MAAKYRTRYVITVNDAIISWENWNSSEYWPYFHSSKKKARATANALRKDMPAQADVIGIIKLRLMIRS